MNWRAFIRALHCLVLLIATTGVACAGSFAVSPVRTVLSAKQTIGSMAVRNDGTDATVVQLEVLRWDQENGKDVLIPSRDLLATPPIFTVAPGGTQIIRIGLRGAADARRELSYRLLLQELPPPRGPEFRGLQVALRLSVPVFVLPVAAAAPALHWQVRSNPDRSLKVMLRNSGNAHVQVAHLGIATADTEHPAIPHQIAAYVLPEQSSTWVLPMKSLPAPGTKLILTAQTDTGVIQSETVLDRP